MATVLQYAGFWKRCVAFVIDSLVLAFIEVMLLLPFFGLVGVGVLDPEMDDSFGFLIAVLGAYMFGLIVIFFVSWLYYGLMESSNSRATVGKIVLGIRVTDLSGNRVSFGRATGRHFGKILSALLFGIGYLMAGFTQQKQALHDIIAGTLVINK